MYRKEGAALNSDIKVKENLHKNKKKQLAREEKIFLLNLRHHTGVRHRGLLSAETAR